MKVVEICAGAGGQSLGLHRAGFTHELAVELDVNAAATLRTNLERLQGGRPDIRVGDVADRDLWRPEDYQGIDLLAGGVPCPPFSVAGRQLGSQDERDLFAWAVELVAHMQPRALLLENVRGLSAPRFSGYRQAVADRLAQLGYWSEWRLLHASDFDVAQLRPRFVLVALKSEYAGGFSWPVENPTKKTVGSVLLPLMKANGWAHAEEWAAQASGIAPTIVGGSKKHGGADLGPTRSKQAWSKLGVDGKGVADTAPDLSAPHYTLRAPRLTNDMVARLQGWDARTFRWDFQGRKTSVYRQIGNAFPPPVARQLGLAIGAALTDARPLAREASRNPHDPVYLALRNSSGPLSEADLLQIVAQSHDAEQVRLSLESLDRDFELQVESDGDAAPRYVLGEFKAFTGQDDHHRHVAFAERGRRAKVS